LRDLIFAHAKVAKVAEDAKVGKGERRFLICNFGLEEGFTVRRFKWTRLWPRPGRGRYGAGGWFWGLSGEIPEVFSGRDCDEKGALRVKHY